jgi:serine/threonine protein kinase
MLINTGQMISHYEILDPVGSGGVADVYRALDTRLGREVALKVLRRTRLDDDAQLARFEREAKLLASVNHPHIASIYEVGQVEDTCFLVLELVPGRSLSDRLADGPFTTDEAFEVFRQIAEGLGAAHVAGVIHRDMKPSNVMLTDAGTIKIVDFGLAKLSGETAAKLPDAESTLTDEGSLFGTLPYMSPEQAQARPITASSDIFSLGVVLYEMLAGQRPFKGDSAAELIASILRDEPPDIERSDLSPLVRRILERCLDKTPDRRFQNAGELLSDIATGTSPDEPTSAGTVLTRPAVAVLPFRNRSDEPEHEYFADGITEEVITALSYWRWFPVIASNSVFAHKGSTSDVKQIGKELGVRYVVEGSLARSGERVRVHVELVDVNSGHQLWTQRYDRELGDVFELQEDIARCVVASIEPELARAELRRTQRKPPENLDAWDLTLRAREPMSQHTLQGYQEASRQLTEALALDQDSSRACSLLASCRYFEAIFGLDGNPTELFAESLRLARRAVRLDSGDWLAHSKLGMGCMWVDRDHDRAVEEITQSLALNPSAPAAHHCLACVLTYGGHFEEALPHLSVLLQLDPKYHWHSSALADQSLAHLMLRHHDEALAFARRAIHVLPGNVRAHQRLVACLGHLGDVTLGRAALDELLKRQPALSEDYFATTYPFRDPEDLEYFVNGLRRAGWSG